MLVCHNLSPNAHCEASKNTQGPLSPPSLPLPLKDLYGSAKPACLFVRNLDLHLQTSTKVGDATFISHQPQMAF